MVAYIVESVLLGVGWYFTVRGVLGITSPGTDSTGASCGPVAIRPGEICMLPPGVELVEVPTLNPGTW